MFRTLTLTMLGILAAGCAGRTAPFNELDKAQITVLRLQGQETPQAAPTATPTGMPGMIPGLPIPPEFQQMGQQALQGLQQVLPPGMIPPGLIPGQQPTAQQPVQAQQPRFKSFVILAQMPLSDEAVKDELLDIFGNESSFQAEKGACFTPGMGVSMARPNGQPVDLLISLSCNQAMGDGFQWPYPTNGFTPETRDRLMQVFQKLWGPAPPSGI